MIFSLKPLAVFLQLTQRCSFQCVGCTNVVSSGEVRRSSGFAQDYLSTKDWETIIDKIAPYVQHITLSGGEPTLFEGFYDIVDCLTDAKVYFSILTNGFWNSPEKIFSKLKENTFFNNFHISVQGYDRESFRNFTGVDGYDIVVRNIELAVREGFKVSTGTVVTHDVFDKTHSIVSFLSSLGVQKVNFNRYIGKDWAGLAAREDELRKCVIDVSVQRQNGKRANLGPCIPLCFEENDSRQCLAGAISCSIDSLGNVFPCIHSSTNCGNIFDQDLLTIWQSSQALAEWRNFLPSQCKGCSLVYSCGGGCKADAFNNNANHDTLMKKTVIKDMPIEPGIKNSYRHNNYTMVVPNYRVEKANRGHVLYGSGGFVPISDRGYDVLQKIPSEQEDLFGYLNTLDEKAIEMLEFLNARGLVELS